MPKCSKHWLTWFMKAVQQFVVFKLLVRVGTVFSAAFLHRLTQLGKLLACLCSNRPFSVRRLLFELFGNPMSSMCARHIVVTCAVRLRGRQYVVHGLVPHQFQPHA